MEMCTHINFFLLTHTLLLVSEEYVEINLNVHN